MANLNWGEKDPLPISERRAWRHRWKRCVVLPTLDRSYSEEDLDASTTQIYVLKLMPLYPDRHARLWDSLGKEFDQDAFTLRAGGMARRRSTCSHHTSHETLALTKVNTYGLLYEWKGSDDSLKPLLLAAHQDVVPVDPQTVDQWKYLPYSGHYDGEFIWGRGSTDDKSGLIGILSSVETLLEKNFKPTRTIVLAFGFDEETTGMQGGRRLSQVLLKKYGEDSFALLVDEGSGFDDIGGSVIAIPGTAEKGYADTMVTVSTAGSHSSVPPPHTVSRPLRFATVSAFSPASSSSSKANPIKPQLERGTPVYKHCEMCRDSMPRNSQRTCCALIKSSTHSDRALRKLEAELIKDQAYKSLIGTTQAIDLIQGGVKSKRPARRSLGCRQSPDCYAEVFSSVSAVQQRDTDILKHLAKEFNLSFTAFGSDITPTGAPTAGKLTLADAWESGLEPAPVTPTDEDSAPWQLLSGTIKAVYNAHRGLEDTMSYWKLTQHIVRYNHQSAVESNAMHTVNELVHIWVDIPADNFVEMIRFFTTLILNVDETTAF
ncbi:hypothetical protein EDB83DRAFT_2312331 [Lactarius deliciosus]|nr:hypothetical protein EDB83DRAFT_2312331 [Lactarius deliciosus]